MGEGVRKGGDWVEVGREVIGEGSRKRGDGVRR